MSLPKQLDFLKFWDTVTAEDARSSRDYDKRSSISKKHGFNRCFPVAMPLVIIK